MNSRGGRACVLSPSLLLCLALAGAAEAGMSRARMEELAKKAKEDLSFGGDTAAFELTRAGKAAVPVLLELIESTNSRLRRRGIRALDELADRSHAPKIMKLLEDPDYSVRSSAGNLLLKMKYAPAIEVVLEKMARGPEDSRAVPGDIAGAGKAAVPGLLKLLDHPKTMVRFRAIQALGQIGDASVAPKLVRFIDDPSAPVRRAVVGSLAQLRYRPALPKVLARFKTDKALVGFERDLVGFGDPAVIPLLKERVAHADAQVRLHAAEALLKLDCRYGMPELIARLKEGPEDAEVSQMDRALSEFTCAFDSEMMADATKLHLKWNTWWQKNKGKSRVEWLIVGLQSGDWGLRRKAAKHLKRLTGKPFVEDRGRWLAWWRAEGGEFRKREDFSVVGARELADARASEQRRQQDARAAGMQEAAAMRGQFFKALAGADKAASLRAAVTPALGPGDMDKLIGLLSHDRVHVRGNAAIALEGLLRMSALMVGFEDPQGARFKETFEKGEAAIRKLDRAEMKRYMLSAWKEWKALGILFKSQGGSGLSDRRFLKAPPSPWRRVRGSGLPETAGGRAG